MNLKEIKEKIVWEKFLFCLFLCVGTVARIWRFGQNPAGMNGDEAYAAYEAYSLLTAGVDSNGYAFPVYFVSWGSGMNVLNSYLMIPFIALFGMKPWAIRMPQLLVACLTMVAVYKLVKKLMGTDVALCSLCILALCPWHIMLSRWGLESNLAPGFIVFGLLFFVYGLENSKYFLLSAVMYGLSLYCYATIWPIVPIMLALQVVYCLLLKKIRINAWTLTAVLILAIFALPLILFLLVNKGVIEPVILPFLSIPKLDYARFSEISTSQFAANLKNLIYIVYHQDDGLGWNADRVHGVFYHITIPFCLLGGMLGAVRALKTVWKREYSPIVLILIQLFGGVLVGMLITVNINRVNIIFIPLIVIAAYGICSIINIVGRKMLLFVWGIYSILFCFFQYRYWTEQGETVWDCYHTGFEKALEEAVSHEGKINISANISYACVLFFRQVPVEDYLETVVYEEYPNGGRRVKAFDRFCIGTDIQNISVDEVYIFNTEEDISSFPKQSFEVKQFDYYVTLVPVESDESNGKQGQ